MKYAAIVRKNWKKFVIKLMLYAVGALFCAPVLFLLSGSIMSRYELTQSLLPLMADNEELISWTLFPDYPTFEHYFRILFQTPPRVRRTSAQPRPTGSRQDAGSRPRSHSR